MAGRIDQAVVDSSTLAILVNNGTGGFTAGDSYTLPMDEEAKAVAVGNFSGHTGGILDIAVLLAPTSLSGDYSVAVYRDFSTTTGNYRHLVWCSVFIVPVPGGPWASRAPALAAVPPDR